jgi:kanosamine 6-kinase
MITLGIDVGATKLAILLNDRKRHLMGSFLLPTDNCFSTDKRAIIEFIGNFLVQSKVKRIDKCVCSAAATINRHGIVKRWPNREHWEGENLQGMFDNLLKIKVIFEDDGNAAAYAEMHARKLHDLIYIGIGSGVGGGIILNKKLVRGERNKAAEFGHMCIVPNGVRCVCDRGGCLQAYASGNAILKNAYGCGWKYHKKNNLQMDFKKNVPSVVKAVNLGAEMLARGLINLNEIFDISNFIIGGGFGSDFFELYSSINYYINCLKRKGQTSFDFFSSKYGEFSSLEGASLLAKI